MNLQWKSIQKRKKVGHVWAGLGSQVDEDSVCRCEIVGFGEIRASTIGASEHDEWYNVSINYKDGEGLFYTLFTYKEPPSSFILEMRVLTNWCCCLLLFFQKWTFCRGFLSWYYLMESVTCFDQMFLDNLCKPFVQIFLPRIRDKRLCCNRSSNVCYETMRSI